MLRVFASVVALASSCLVVNAQQPAPPGPSTPQKTAPTYAATPPLTHVTRQQLDVFAVPGGKGQVVHRLAPGTQLSVVETKQGWAHIFRDGKLLGYVPEDKLEKIKR